MSISIKIIYRERYALKVSPLCIYFRRTNNTGFSILSLNQCLVSFATTLVDTKDCVSSVQGYSERAIYIWMSFNVFKYRYISIKYENVDVVICYQQHFKF